MNYNFIDTNIGECAIAWKSEKVCGFILPEIDRDALILKINPDQLYTFSPIPPSIQSYVTLLIEYFNGSEVNLSSIPLHYESDSDFFINVWNFTKMIPYGEVITYKELAQKIGSPKSQQAIGRAMSKNPITIIIPCHRVIAKKALGGFSSHQGVSLKRKLLQMEGVKVNGVNQLEFL